jgi:UDP-N-acetylglucosamine 3-dehydrogenase
MAKKLGVGFIGTGGVADLHAPGYRSSEVGEIVAVCDVREEVAKQKAAAWGAKSSYSDYKKLLADPAVDVVDICLPNGFHAEVTIAAAEAGKHVLVEKPMAISVQQCDEMIRAAKKNNVKLMVEHNQTFYPPHIETKRLIQGEIGKPIMLVTTLHIGFGQGPRPARPAGPQNWRADPKQSGGGFLMEAGVHRVYLSRFLMGEVKSVYGVAAKTDPELASEDIGFILFEFANGSRGVLTGNQGGPFPLWDDRTEVVGSKGMVIVNGFEEQAIPGAPLMFYKNGTWTYYVKRGHAATVGDMDLGTNEIEAEFPKTYVHAVQHFLDCVANDKTPSVTGEDGRRAVEIVLAAYESSDKQRPVTLTPP